MLECRVQVITFGPRGNISWSYLPADRVTGIIMAREEEKWPKSYWACYREKNGGGDLASLVNNQRHR